jgi:hypothetical protein
MTQSQYILHVSCHVWLWLYSSEQTIRTRDKNTIPLLLSSNPLGLLLLEAHGFYEMVDESRCLGL